MDQERLIQLTQLPLHQPRANHINDPHLDILRRDGQRARDLRIGQAALMLRLCGRKTRQREQPHLSQQDRGIQLLAREEIRVGIEPLGIILQPLRVEEFEQFIPGRVVRVAEGLHGVAVGEVLKDEVGGVGEGGLAGADGEVVRWLGGGFGGGDGAQRAEQVGIGFVVVADGVGGFGDLEEEGSLVLFVGVPEADPGVEVLELGAQDFEEAGGADDAEDGEEDVVAGFGVVGEDVEDGGEDGEGEARAIGGGGGDRIAEVGDDFGEEDEEVGGLDDQVDEEVVGRDEFCWKFDVSQFSSKILQDRYTNRYPYLSPVHCSVPHCQ